MIHWHFSYTSFLEFQRGAGLPALPKWAGGGKAPSPYHKGETCHSLKAISPAGDPPHPRNPCAQVRVLPFGTGTPTSLVGAHTAARAGQTRGVWEGVLSLPSARAAGCRTLRARVSERSIFRFMRSVHLSPV